MTIDAGALPVVRDIPSAIHKVLRDAIQQGQLAAGSRIKIDELAERFGVSKIPIREALRLLESDGWVHSRPHRGTYVRPLSRDELGEIFEMRKLIEPHSAALAAKRRSAAHVAELQDIVQESRRAIDATDLSTITELNKRLHGVIADAAGNSLLTETLQKLDLLMRRYFVPVSWDQRRQSMLQHVEIVQAIADQDGPLAKRLLLAHICHTEALAREFMPDADLTAAPTAT